jgi:hypothetical protein
MQPPSTDLATGEGGGRCVVAIPGNKQREQTGGHTAPTHRPPEGRAGRQPLQKQGQRLANLPLLDSSGLQARPLQMQRLAIMDTAKPVIPIDLDRANCRNR